MMDSPDQEEYLLFSWLHNNYGKHNRFCMRSYRFGNISHVMFCCQRKNVVSHQDQIWLFSSKTISLSVYLEKKEEERDNTVLCFFGFFFWAALGLLRCAGFLQLRRAGATLHCGAWASHCRVFSVAEHRLQARGLQQLQHAGSVVVACGPQSAQASVVVGRRLSSCGARAQLLHGMWDLPRPGIEPTSAALAGGFLTTVQPRKSDNTVLTFL